MKNNLIGGKIIGHVDADCFYVSCERVRDERLKGKPVAVLGNQGACVIARSYEMRPFGVKVGMPIWQARQLCAEGIYVKRDFSWYGILSKRMQEVLGEFSDVVEYYSVDESFVDFGNYMGDQTQLALEIQQRILEEVGVPVSVGIGPTRLLAKIGSDWHKPFGVMVVNSDNIVKFLNEVEVGDVSGIGRKSVRRLHAHGIETAADFVARSPQEIRKILHKPGEQIWYELQGKSLSPIRGELPLQKMLSRGGSIWGHYDDRDYIWGFLVRNLERLVTALWYDGLETDHLSVRLMASDGRCFQGGRALKDFSAAFEELLVVLKKVFEEIYVPGVLISGVHIFAFPLRSASHKQLHLFHEADEKSGALKALRQKVNARFGPFTLRSAATAFVPEVFRDVTSNVEITDIEGKALF